MIMMLRMASAPFFFLPANLVAFCGGAMAAGSGSPNLPQCDRKPCEIALPRRRGKADYISISML
jgi:hypothetical protein